MSIRSAYISVACSSGVPGWPESEAQAQLSGLLAKGIISTHARSPLLLSCWVGDPSAAPAQPLLPELHLPIGTRKIRISIGYIEYLSGWHSQIYFALFHSLPSFPLLQLSLLQLHLIVFHLSSSAYISVSCSGVPVWPESEALLPGLLDQGDHLCSCMLPSTSLLGWRPSCCSCWTYLPCFPLGLTLI